MNVVLTMSFVMQLLCRMALNAYFYETKINGRVVLTRPALHAKPTLPPRYSTSFQKNRGAFLQKGAVYWM